MKNFNIDTKENTKATYIGKYILLDDLIDRIKKADSLCEIETLCELFKMIYESKGEEL